MLTQLDLRNFKCFELLRLPLGALTLLSGTNASGKSSVLQSLVLMHQTMREHEWSTRLMLNGTATKLGTVTDVVDQVYGRDSFDIGLIDDDVSYQWDFTGDRDEMSLRVKSVRFRGKVKENPLALHYLLPIDADNTTQSLAIRIRDLNYITAERIGPREVYPLEDSQIVPVVGPEGENVVSVLYRGRDEHVSRDLMIKGTAPTLLHQVEARMGTFFRGCALSVQQVQNANSATMGIRTSFDTGFLRPINSGFGITQILPIIVAALSTAKGSILLVENPEVHLHPAGQALMGQFLADVAHAGIQVIVETHSDHILNGVRRSVKAERLPTEQVAIHFFRPRSEGGPPSIEPDPGHFRKH